MSHLKRPFLVFPGAQTNAKYRCHRCMRDLSELAFRRLIRDERYGIAAARMATAYHPICKSCLTQLKGEYVGHPLYSPSVDRYLRSLISSARANAASRGIGFLLESDDLLGLFIEQRGKCSISGAQFRIEKVESGRINRLRPSVDRIDSRGHYTPDNVHLVCAIVNTMKSDMTQAELLRWCQRIVETAVAKEGEMLAVVSQ